jgi:hypothetical protein
MADIEAIAKSRDGHNFKFRGIDDVYNEIHSILAKHKVFTSPEVLKMDREERQSASGGVKIYSILTIKYTFYAEDGSSFTAVTVGEGMDSSDKASNKSMSVAHKYALLQVFCIPTVEKKDPEDDEHGDLKPKGDKEPGQEQKPASSPNDRFGANKHERMIRAFANFNVTEKEILAKYRKSELKYLSRNEIDELGWIHEQLVGKTGTKPDFFPPLNNQPRQSSGGSR